MEGKLSARVGEESSVVESGHIVLVPKMVPHDLRNTGTQKARVLGVFGGTNNIVATFEKEWLPTHSHIVDTAQL